ncbi:MAG: LGFP repeat-containing protein [Microbacterium sp.]|uniref:LGFP repeat-containing protein n=1 Tax=Microbacterium sp. TaxID=51671 RepID=UPI003F7ED943
MTADLSKFQPGNIISDEVFFAKDAMTETQIQTFLEQKVPRCQAGYTCLRDKYDISRTTAADPMCSAYAGGVSERASRIIYKVAQACGINPQVLLVMLEKEQSLVTHVWPSDFRYLKAMGQACPDTGDCDARYLGFFNQVYGAAWQMKRYGNPPGTSKYFTWYAPGKSWSVLWHPLFLVNGQWVDKCGSAPVYIQNQATANLYYYTPYQPNAAAIRAGYGASSDICASYGNRNFYQFFTDWFGSTQGFVVLGAMGARWAALGGKAGVLGSPVAAEVCDWTPGRENCYQDFQNGAISWTAATGAWETYGPVRARWQALKFETGVLGYPVGAYTCGTKDGGCYQDFQNGAISWTAATGAWETYGDIRAYWRANGYETGFLRYPTGASTATSTGLLQTFQGGSVTWSSSTGNITVTP